MDLLGLGSIVSGLSGIAQGAINARQSRKNIDKTIAANRELSEYQYSKDLEMWERANEYNNPSSQMMRLKEAGLNPNMAYSSGNVGGMSTTQAPKYQKPREDYNYQPVIQNLPTALGAYQDFRMRQAQIDNVKEQNQVIKQTGLIKANEAAVSGSFYKSRALQKQWRSGMDALEYGYEMGYDKIRDAGGKLRTIGKTRYGRMAGYQLQYADERNRRIGVDIDRMNRQMQYIDTKIDYQNKVNDLYNTLAYSRLGFGAANQIMKVVPAGKGAKGLKGLGGMPSATKRILENKWQSWRK